MLKINIVCVGNLKEDYYILAEREYVKRLSRFANLKIIELKEKNELATFDVIKQKEGEEILKNLNGYVVVMDINGKTGSSEDFAQLLDDAAMLKGEITFVIGGSYGLCEDVKNLANAKWSFSKQTFTHNMFRIMLEEQIYRAFQIQNKTGYHK